MILVSLLIIHKIKTVLLNIVPFSHMVLLSLFVQLIAADFFY